MPATLAARSLFNLVVGASVLGAALSGATLGCAGSNTFPAARPGAKEPASTAVETSDDGLASLVAVVSAGTLGPYVGYGPNGAMALFAPPRDTGRRWIVQPLHSSGARAEGPYDIGPAPEDVPFAVVKPIGDSFLAMWVRRVHRADVLEGIMVGADGSVPGSMTAMVHAQGSVMWADAVGTSKGTLVVWVEQRGRAGDLRRMIIDSRGEPVGQAEGLVTDVLAWETVKLDDGLAVALVVGAGSDASWGTVVLLILDNAGKPKGPPVAVSEPGSARPDVGLVRTQRGLVMAWTGRH